jgi:hypothetical protein
MLKESAYALGSTTWEVVSRVVLPYTKGGVVGGIMLGLGRALGETMAVTFVIGNFNQLDSLSLFQPANSITSALANEFAEAASGLHQASLIYLGLVLFFITFVVLACPSCCWRACAGRRGAVMSGTGQALLRRPMRPACARAATRAQARQPGGPGAVARRHGLRRVLAGVDPVRDRPARRRRPDLGDAHQMTPPPNEAAASPTRSMARS